MVGYGNRSFLANAVALFRHQGLKALAFDKGGTALADEVGELVITEPMPSMPLFVVL